MTSTRNPFAAEAVATYGKPRPTCEDLQYMAKVGSELRDYLAAHPSESRYGAAIGLRGEHGSGKTHILNWLGETARASQKIRSTVLYGKCDSSSFFDLYRQFTLDDFDRDTLVTLLQLALLNLARAKVRSAKVTEELAAKLQTVGALQVLQAEKNIDLQQLRQQLLIELRAGGCPAEMARVILDAPDPKIGVDAHRWITGNDVPPDRLEALGVSYQLSAVSQAPVLADRASAGQTATDPAHGEQGASVAIADGSGAQLTPMPSEGSAEKTPALTADPEGAAITALSALATLHRVAGVPLIVLVDQLEVLVRVPEGQPFQMLSSLLKKFVEELSSRAAFVVVAGIREPWRRLPRDVPARFRGRAELVVGSLTQAETALLLSAYTRELNLTSFGPRVIEQICELSGGNPREILRVAYQLFENSDGNLSSISGRTEVLNAAQSAGTIADREVQALAALDAVLREFNLRQASDLILPGSFRIDRALMDPSGDPVALFEIVKATDAIDEVGSARRVQGVLENLNKTWRGASLIVISVGYSSSEVRNLLGDDVTLVKYDDKTFEGELRTHIVTLLRVGSVAREEQPNPNAALHTRMEEMTSLLKRLEAERLAQQKRIDERFQATAAELAKPAVEERRLQTRREVLDALDTVRERLIGGELQAEQRLIRSTLIANESYLKDRVLDDLGEAYLEAIGLERTTGSQSEMLRNEREKLLGEMSRNLRRPTALAMLTRRRWEIVIVTLILSLATFVGYVFQLNLPYEKGSLQDLTRSTVMALGVMSVGGAYLASVVWWLDRRRATTIRNRIDDIRERAKSRAPESTLLRGSYPQTSR
jgi:hypothetical protein